MPDVTDFEAFRDRKQQKAPEAVDYEMSDRKKLIYQDVNGWWQVIIEGENIPVQQYEEMPDHIIEQIETQHIHPGED